MVVTEFEIVTLVNAFDWKAAYSMIAMELGIVMLVNAFERKA